mmetsp:Transcript_11867/g.30106  ORF Transcript_11867/g.30106 Transcript_11867/m.30106 type:complete len:106 (+) Transcript_11867:731-1048(+)
MLAFILLPVPPASNTNPTSPMSGVTKLASPFAALNFVIDGGLLVDTKAEAMPELNAKIKANRKKDIVVDFMVAGNRKGYESIVYVGQSERSVVVVMGRAPWLVLY